MHRMRFVFLLGLVVYQFLLAPFFSHIHEVNGLRVVHQHPYAAHHDHTTQGYVLVDIANENTGIAAEMQAIPAFFCDVCSILLTLDVSLVPAHLHVTPSLRAPPVVEPAFA